MLETFDLQSLAQLAQRAAAQLPRACTVCLSGPLGSGKTTFVRCFCQAAGAVEQVSSPSFVMQNEYHTPGGLIIEHWDLYRTTDAPEELFEPPDTGTIRFIEWAEHAPQIIDRADLVITLNFHDNPLSSLRTAQISGTLACALKNESGN